MKLFRKLKSKINLWRVKRRLAKLSPEVRRKFIEIATR